MRTLNLILTILAWIICLAASFMICYIISKASFNMLGDIGGYLITFAVSFLPLALVMIGANWYHNNYSRNPKRLNPKTRD